MPESGGDAGNDEVAVVSPPVEEARQKLRQRWELASVLNFLNVFEPVIESGLKLSAEEIETALIEQNDVLAELHKALLKGVCSSNKQLDNSDAWMIALSKKLSMWWPWVAEGDFPLNGVRGEEISLYKGLDPTVRLLILKALCEVRAEQGDVVSYINDAIKSGSELSTFRKEKVSGNDKEISFWYDGNATIGYRLYREVCTFESKRKLRGKDAKPAVDSQWEVVATNLDEFQKIADDLSSSELNWEVAVSKAVEADAIPVLLKLKRKKEKQMKRKQREQSLLDGLRNSRICRSTRNRGHIDYTFDNYDRSIKEAIQYANQRKKIEKNGKHEETIQTDSGVDGSAKNTEDSEFMESDTAESSDRESEENDEGTNDDKCDGEHDGDGNKNRKKSLKPWLVDRSKALRSSKRLAGVPGCIVPESLTAGAKNRLRQRPSVNTAIESSVVPDSEDEKSSDDVRGTVSGNSSPDAATTVNEDAFVVGF